MSDNAATLCPGPHGAGCDCKAEGKDPLCPWWPLHPEDVADDTPARTYRIDFERVGRNHFVPPLEVEAVNGDVLAHHIHAYAGRFLGSKDYEVTVNGDHGLIGWGRFGRFTVEEVESSV